MVSWPIHPSTHVRVDGWMWSHRRSNKVWRRHRPHVRWRGTEVWWWWAPEVHGGRARPWVESMSIRRARSKLSPYGHPRVSVGWERGPVLMRRESRPRRWVRVGPRSHGSVRSRWRKAAMWARRQEGVMGSRSGRRSWDTGAWGVSDGRGEKRTWARLWTL